MSARRGLLGKLVFGAVVAYLGIGLMVASWTTTRWAKGGVHQPAEVFLRDMLLWPLWLPAILITWRGD